MRPSERRHTATASPSGSTATAGWDELRFGAESVWVAPKAPAAERVRAWTRGQPVPVGVLQSPTPSGRLHTKTAFPL
jgi:hypothetical protein